MALNKDTEVIALLKKSLQESIITGDQLRAMLDRGFITRPEYVSAISYSIPELVDIKDIKNE